MSDGHPLDNPVRAALLGPHAHLAQRHGQVLRYPPDVSPWHALPDDPDAEAWADLALLAGPGGVGAFAGAPAEPPLGWERVMLIPGVQLVDARLRAERDHEALPLGPADVPEMLELVARTRPGPFAVRTIEMGSYLGIRRAGRLVAMGGERLHPPGWTEISAVCTDVEHRGQGLATRLVRAVAAGIRARGETPFLHAAAPTPQRCGCTRHSASSCAATLTSSPSGRRPRCRSARPTDSGSAGCPAALVGTGRHPASAARHLHTDRGIAGQRDPVHDRRASPL